MWRTIWRWETFIVEMTAFRSLQRGRIYTIFMFDLPCVFGTFSSFLGREQEGRSHLERHWCLNQVTNNWSWSVMEVYAATARCRVHLATVFLRPPSGHRPGRHQARHARISQIELHLSEPWNLWTPPQRVRAPSSPSPPLRPAEQKSQGQCRAALCELTFQSFFPHHTVKSR